MSATEHAIDGGLAQRALGVDPVLRGVQRLAQLAERAAEPEQVYRALAHELASTLGAEEAHVHHLGVDPAQRELVVVYVGDGDGRLSYHCSVAERPPAVGWVASTGRSFLAGDERELLAALPGVAGRPGAGRCALLLPLRLSRRTAAVIVLVGRRSFAEGALDQAGVLVDQAATALALLRARAEAGTDAVTGCMNHRAMRRRLGEEIARTSRSHGSLSCMLIDLDDFKLVNDRHGHPAGDKLLRNVATALMREFRSFDRVARYGGDEFVVILPDTHLDSATSAAERALARLQRIAAPGGRGSAGELLSASIGVAGWREGMSLDELLQECDAALLQGKREGKRRVTSAR